jgi:NADH dehydrogenase
VILVTGATGFVGQRIVHALRAQDRPVRCLVRSSTRARTLEAWGCEIAVGDVTDPASLVPAVSGCDALIHLVAIIAGRPADFDRVMSQGTRNVIAAAKEASVRRFVLMSALGVSEQTKDLVPYYGSKWTMELAVKDSGLEHVIFRPSFVLGPGGGVIPQFSRMVRYLPVLPVAGAGTQRIQPIFVEDVAAFFARSTDLPEAANRTFSLCGPEVVTWNEFWARLGHALGKRRPTVHVPTGLLRLPALGLELLPKPPVTRDQLTMLEAGDNVCDPREAVEMFGVELTPLDVQLERSIRDRAG